MKKIKKYLNKKRILVWLLLLFGVALMGTLFPLKTGYLAGGNMDAYKSKPWLYWLANFDGDHYISIAKRGYVQFQQAFFPLYSYLISRIASFFKNSFQTYFFSGIALSFVCFLLFFRYLKRLIKKDFKKFSFKKTKLIYLLYPTAFFLISIYTESLFLFLAVAAFYFYSKKRKILYIFFSSLATATRLIGVFIPFSIFLEYLIKAFDDETNKKIFSVETLKKGLTSILASSGLLYYMNYLWQTKNDPLYFFHVQPEFGANRSGGKLILPYQVLWRYIKIIFTANPRTVEYFVAVQEIALTVLFIAVFFWAIKKVKSRYLIYSGAVIILPTLTGTLSSMPRYIMAAFPLFIVLSKLKKRKKKILLAVFAILLIINLILFSRGYFVS